MNERQRAMLLDVISEWANIVNENAAAARMAEIRADMNDTRIRVNRTDQRHARHQYGIGHYRIQGPHLVIEYAPQGPWAAIPLITSIRCTAIRPTTMAASLVANESEAVRISVAAVDCSARVRAQA